MVEKQYDFTNKALALFKNPDGKEALASGLNQIIDDIQTEAKISLHLKHNLLEIVNASILCAREDVERGEYYKALKCIGDAEKAMRGYK